MDHKEAIIFLIKILERRALSAQEKEAVLTAIGVLSWTSLAKSRLQRIKNRRAKTIKSQ